MEAPPNGLKFQRSMPPLSGDMGKVCYSTLCCHLATWASDYAQVATQSLARVSLCCILNTEFQV
eukprot:CAMPEP_0204127084 /NCGR_PEP_ID=MMETSP0361-20130328/11382_1 /ASSEMBLY_ACC=CAM_ASM_000343 /TAXON_ID=268821 /ORGANISM="Scrippsiella Hangoei, Strain SHTV-5" /LENGTH=63 /DNA_ID=CAMNT_0051079067 /DNA_START=115 /DNA_END=306 /DNA_ORIENTATION=+